MDIVFLVEHKNRELSLVNKIAATLQSKYGLQCRVMSLIFHTHYLFNYKPKLIVVPFGHRTDIWPLNIVRQLYNDTVPILTLNWEQMLAPIMQEYKSPRGVYVKERVYHVAWFDYFKEYLENEGVNAGQIKVCGSPKVEDLTYTKTERESCHSKVQNIVDVDQYEHTVFMPMHLSWSWHTDRQVQAKIDQGFPAEEGWAYREFAKKTRKAFIKFLQEAATRNPSVLFVVRPHPSIIPDDYVSVYHDVIGQAAPGNVLFNDQLTVREWVAVADCVGSTWSTVCYDAQQMGKKTFLYVPFKRPEWFDSPWRSQVLNLESVEEFEGCLKSDKGSAKQDSGMKVFSEEVSFYIHSIVDGQETHAVRRPLSIKLNVLEGLIKRTLLNVIVFFGGKKNKNADNFKPITIR